MKQTVQLSSAAWYGDHPLNLEFPATWEVALIGAHPIPALTPTQMIEQFQQPIGAPRLAELAAGRKRAAIIVDDSTRPTPAAQLLPFILSELHQVGFADDAITIIVAGGTHRPATSDEISKKLGAALPTGITVSAHDSRRDCVYVGQSSRGTPLYVNQAVMACDLKIGVGCIYPHPAAGFSGGSKIVMPAVCGSETVRHMHDYLRAARTRGGSLDTELRREIEDVAARVGLDFIVNVVLNQKRQIGGLFVGDRQLAHRRGVQWATNLYHIAPVHDAQIVVADIYPFDINLQFAHDRGFWPLEGLAPSVSKVGIAACSQGVGSHDLYPISHTLTARLARRLKHLQLKEFRDPWYKLQTMIHLWREKRQELLMYVPVWEGAQGLTPAQLHAVFPRAKLYAAWPQLLVELQTRHLQLPVKVAVYQCAPLLLPLPAVKVHITTSSRVAHQSERAFSKGI